MTRPTHRFEAHNQFTWRNLMRAIAATWLVQPPYDRGEVHAQKITDPHMVTREITDATIDLDIFGQTIESLGNLLKPNFPWANDHFLERVGGEPLNPPPSHEYWPFNRAGNAEHLINGKFSHTYPERFWPKQAGLEHRHPSYRAIQDELEGIRFEYGDLDDLVQVLKANPRSRQAYLPVWFPEDLAAAVDGQRVPCTLGYHFMQHGRDEALHMTYYMRSCDIVRFFVDDVYMSARLLQWVAHEVGLEAGSVRLHISSLHAFEGDRTYLESLADGPIVDKRTSYNLDALG